MATEEIKSSLVTNTTATPLVANSAHLDGGRVRSKRAVATAVLAAADVGSTYRFFRVKSSDLVRDLKLDAVAFGGAAAMDIGVYAISADGSVTATGGDADLFGSAVSMVAAQRGTDVLRESGVITVANMEKRVWELLGLSADPQTEYEVVGTVTTIFAAAGAMALTAEVVGGY